ncbi:MAG: 50S ribosomal protein L9 [Bacteroidia bacterium]|jgi:large subunit ribosomal protein L9|nr:50S ribosomal protein L9 [Bacteroidia bacterium]MCC6768916.1 50S ribosomal protein L9 [Bacteroidia bacterium]
MEIILKQDVANLGHKDEIVKVKNGYGSNYLIPKGFAIPANESNRKVLQETLRQRAHKEEKLRKDAESMAEKLVKSGIEVGAKVGESGKIYGSVNNIQLAEALKKKGYDIDRKNITLDTEAIKTVGTYTAHIKIYKDIKVDVEFDVVAE